MGGLQGLQPTNGLLQPTATRDQEGPGRGRRARRARTARRIRIAQYSICMYVLTHAEGVRGYLFTATVHNIIDTDTYTGYEKGSREEMTAFLLDSR